MKNTMKKIAWLILTAALLTCFGLTAGLAEAGNFEGTWVSDRCTIEITPDGDYWICEIAWPNSASENYEWVYTCTYDEATDSLVSEAGALNDVTYDENGEITSVMIVYDDGAAKFSLNDDFKLVWQDEKEDAGKDMVFDYVVTPALTGAGNFEGTWETDRCTIEIKPDGDYWICEIAWPNSASENYEWVYTCTYDEATDSLVSEAGALNDVTYDENGEITSVMIVYDDGAAKFSLNDDFKLVWQDEKEDAGKDMVFDYVVMPAEAPTVEALTEGYFKALANLEVGTAGASLKTAIAADAVCHFAADHLLYNPDVDALRANMVEAFDAMGEDEQNAFWQGFDAVRPLLDDCLEDWEANRAQFEDAGVAESMDEIMYDPLNRLAWENLRDHTLTMGNDMNVG